jgi:tRNA A37 threonylcarbamoyladenosine synthetase subunit TsaC/SUA5/YrdC
MAQYFEVHPDNPQPRLLKQAVALLERGGIVAVPTDSSYALACHLDDKAPPTSCAASGVWTTNTTSPCCAAT